MTVFLDTCAIVYWVEASDPFYTRFIERLWQIHAESPDAVFAISRLSLLECLVRPLRNNDQVLLSDYRVFFAADQLKIIELSASVVEQAAHLRAYHGLTTPDALQAASALSLPSEVLFITSDQRFARVPGLNVLAVA